MGRLDNLAMSYLSLCALIDSTFGADALNDETAIKAVALFDHEEVGSASAQGERLGCCCGSTNCVEPKNNLSLAMRETPPCKKD